MENKELLIQYDQEVNRLRKELKQLEEENKKLNSINQIHVDRIQELMRRLEKRTNRINKAIEYINNYLPNYDFDHYNLEKLLKILKGE